MASPSPQQPYSSSDASDHHRLQRYSIIDSESDIESSNLTGGVISLFPGNYTITLDFDVRDIGIQSGQLTVLSADSFRCEPMLSDDVIEQIRMIEVPLNNGWPDEATNVVPREEFIMYIGPKNPRFSLFFYNNEDCIVFPDERGEPHQCNSWRVQPGDVFFIMDIRRDLIVFKSIDGFCSSSISHFSESTPFGSLLEDFIRLPTESNSTLSELRDERM